MPKETIHRKSVYIPVKVSKDAELPGTAETTTLTVGWSPEQGIDIVAVHETREAEKDAKTDEVWEKQGELASDFWIYSNLERREVNNLIRTLRRARDRVFGRDE